MPCCGQGRAAASGSSAVIKPAARPPAQNLVFYEYTGISGMTVRGPSGASYRFGHSGARVAIDPRDVASIDGLPHLRPVK